MNVRGLIAELINYDMDTDVVIALGDYPHTQFVDVGGSEKTKRYGGNCVYLFTDSALIKEEP